MRLEELKVGGLVEEVDLELRKSGFGGRFDYTTLLRGCLVHLPEMGSLGYSGFGIRLLRISTGFSVW